MKKRMHVVYKTHLDIGFTDLAESVIQQYMEDFIPRAVRIGEEVPELFTWTTGAWLIERYLEAATVSQEAKEKLIKRIQGGQICWHGLPYTLHTELLDQELLTYGLSISQRLDQQFNKKTIAGKMTDVPGHTIALVPALQAAGIQYLHIGVNASSAVPTVPEIFLWRGADGSEVICHYAGDYGAVFAREDWQDALYFAHSHDNAGPPADAQEVRQLFERLQREYPDYEIVASTLDAFAAAILPYKASLTVVEEEIGDTWIHGVMADPLKIADYRNLLALRRQWLAEGKLTREQPAYHDFSAALLLVAEHTWGLNGNVYFPEYHHFLPEDLQQARQQDLVTFQHQRDQMDYGDLMAVVSTDIQWQEMANRRRSSLYEQSWQEQRNYVEMALMALPDRLRQEAEQMLQRRRQLPMVRGEVSILPGVSLTFDQCQLTFATTGGISSFKVAGHEYILPEHSFGELTYQSYDFLDYQRFFRGYSRLNRWTTGWAMGDFGRRGIEAVPEIRGVELKPFIRQGSYTRLGSQIVFQFLLDFPEAARQKWGLPKENHLFYTLDLEDNQLTLQYQWRDKAANRAPESYWLETSLATNNPTRWQMHKISQSVSPLNVVKNGNRNLHLLSEEGLTYQGTEGFLQLQSQEAPLFAFGGRRLLQFDNQLPNFDDGIFVNLYNNVWGTNFPAWFEDDMTYQVKFGWQLTPGMA